MPAQWAQQILLAAVGLSAGVAAAGGLFAFIVELGVVADFADRTHTGDRLLFYETSVALGGILGIFGIFSGIFVGCWSMALAEILNVFPVFMRRARIVRYIAAFTISVAVGKGLGAGLFFFRGW